MIKKIFTNVNFLLNPKEKIKFYVIVLANLVTTILEMISLSLIPVFIGMILKVDQFKNNKLFEVELIENFFKRDYNEKFIFLSIFIIFIFSIKNIFSFYTIYIEGKFIRNLKIKHANKFYDLYIKLPIIKHYGYNSATFQKNIIQETKLGSEYIGNISIIIKELLLFIGIFILLITINYYVSFSILFLAGSMSLTYYFIVRKRVKKDTEKSVNLREFQIKSVNQVFASIKETRILNTTKYFIDEFTNKTFKFENILFLITLIVKIPRYLIEILVISIILIFSILLLQRGYQIENLLPILGLLVIASIRLIPSFNNLTASFTRLKQNEVSVKILIDELNKNKINKTNFYSNNITKLSLDSSIKIQNISFSFPESKKEIFKDFSLEIKKGEKIGVVGPSGSGKTTLINIILGFFPPDKGKVSADNKDIHLNLKSWHSRIGYIPQEIYLLDDTVLKNIALGIKEDAEDLNKLEVALKSAEIYDFINNLPDGINTMVGDRGIRFSGGQRQRVGIARALYRDPNVLIFDEATSSLDEETEKKFIENIFNLNGNRTIIISTHKLNSLNKCDKIYSIKNNKLEILKK
jgi:ATP-binding cassette, subfamily B, bacterial PglK